jgi:endonuclease III
MHAGGNTDTLFQRMKLKEFHIASDFLTCQQMNRIELKNLFGQFVPGSRTKSKGRKIDSLISIVETIRNAGGIELFITPEKGREELLKMLEDLDGIGCKVARNILMNLYHPKFRNNTIPIDFNWKKIGNYLNKNWSDPCRHEKNILEFRNKHISREIIKEDWEFDRTVYQALNHKGSSLNRLLKEVQ